MSIPTTVADVIQPLGGIISFDENGAVAEDIKRFREQHLDSFVERWMKTPPGESRMFYAWLLKSLAESAGVIPSSIAGFYRAKGEGKFPKMTVPAIVPAELSYARARTIFRAARASNTRAFLTRWDALSPQAGDAGDAVLLLILAALREGFTGPLFLQATFRWDGAETGDAEASLLRTEREIQRVLEAGFLNLVIDTTALVQRGGATFEDQQRTNVEMTSRLANAAKRSTAGAGATIAGSTCSPGGLEAKTDDLRAFLEGCLGSESGTNRSLSMAFVPADNGRVGDLVEMASHTYRLPIGVSAAGRPVPAALWDELVRWSVSEVSTDDGAELERMFRRLSVAETLEAIANHVDVVKRPHPLPEPLRKLVNL